MRSGAAKLECILSDSKDKIFVTDHGYVLFFKTINIIKGRKETSSSVHHILPSRDLG